MLTHKITALGPDPVRDRSGGVTHPQRPTVFTNAACRIEAKQSSQITALGELVFKTVYTVYTKQTGIVNGQILQADDGETTRTLRVEGNPKNAALGTLDSFFEVPCVEIGTGKDK